MVLYRPVCDSTNTREQLSIPLNTLNLNLRLDLLVLDLRLVLRKTQLRRERLGRLPLGRQAGSSLGHHLVDLLERQTLGLWDEEVRVYDCRPSSVNVIQ